MKPNFLVTGWCWPKDWWCFLLLWSIPAAFFTVIALGAHHAHKQGHTDCVIHNLYDIHCKRR